jgi:hypothetical protein
MVISAIAKYSRIARIDRSGRIGRKSWAMASNFAAVAMFECDADDLQCDTGNQKGQSGYRLRAKGGSRCEKHEQRTGKYQHHPHCSTIPRFSEHPLNSYGILMVNTLQPIRGDIDRG